MNDGIEYNPIGTVDVTFDDKTYHLGLPKMRQFRHFTRLLADFTTDVSKRMAEVQGELAAAQEKYADNEDSPEARAEVDRLAAAVSELTAEPFYERTAQITAEMFAQIGDPLPDDLDDWPVWLAADAAIPGRILAHWRLNPLASGTGSQS